MRLRDTHGPRALAGFGSAKGSNEEAYLFQKLVRLGFGSNNVDHCTRLCHASSVAALLEGLGSGAVSNPVMDVTQAEVVLVIGANPTVNHPVAATWIKNAVRRGTRLVVIDPRRNELARHAHLFLQFKPDSDVALLNAMLHAIIEEGLADARFIAERTLGFEALREHVRGCSPEWAAPITGIEAQAIREVARLYATSRASMILWGMGISQHVHGTDNARCLIALALATGQIGRPGTGLHPLRGQNNVQGASDCGADPDDVPRLPACHDAAARERFAAAWGVPADRLDPQVGLTVVELIHAMIAREVRGMVIMGENPAMSDPDANHAREALARLDMLVVQDIFLTETACLADVVLPASAFAEKTGSFTNTDRTVQIGRAALTLPGQARQDLWIITALARQLGLDWSDYGATPTDCAGAAAAVFDEMRRLMPSIAGITWQRLQHEGSVTYPCHHEGDPGTPVVFTDRFPTPTGRGLFVPPTGTATEEQPDADYPLVLITGRQLEHWHTGSMTRRSAVLDAIEPDAVALVHPQELARIGCTTGRPHHDHLAPRRGEPLRARRRRHAARRGVRRLLLGRGGDQQAHPPGAGPGGQDTGLQILRGASGPGAVVQPRSPSARTRPASCPRPRRKASQRASCSRLTYSSAWCACEMEPGPQTTVDMPARWNSPASVPKATSVVAALPASACASRTAASSGRARKAGISAIGSKRKPAPGSTACIAGSRAAACSVTRRCIAATSLPGRSRNS